MKKLVNRLLFSVLFPLYYKWQCRRRLQENNALFIELRYLEMTNNFRYLYEALQEKGISCDLYCMGNHGISGFSYMKRCLEMLKKLAVSKYAFINDVNNVIGSLTLRKQTILVQTWHGCGAFKKFGFHINSNLEKRFYPKCNMVTVSSPAVVPIYKEAMGLDAQMICPLGVSRTDLFFRREQCQKMREQCFKKLGGRGKKKYILYAPTFRGNAHYAEMPHLLEPQELYDFLGEEYVILFKGHPAMRESVAVTKEYKDFYRDVSKGYTIEELMLASDLCITDYSSLIFEYALLDKPMIFYAYDSREYEQERGFYFSYEEFIPGAYCTTSQQVIQEVLQPSGEYGEKRKEFCEKFMSACDGHATERIIEQIQNIGVCETLN